MIRITSEWAQGAAKRSVHLPPPQIYISFATPLFIRTRYRSLPWSTPLGSMTRAAVYHTTQSTITKPLDGSKALAKEAIISAAFDPHTYTTGRWLRRDRLERDARYIKFDFDALRRKVVELCPGARSIPSYENVEGGFNRIFIFTCHNATHVVARLPTKVAEPPRLTTNSEVAPIRYRRSDAFTAGQRALAARLHMSQYSPTLMYRYQPSLTGAMTLQILLAANILLWNTPRALSCSKNGQPCLGSSKLPVFRPLLRIFSR